MSNTKTAPAGVGGWGGGSPASPSHYRAFDKFITSGFANDSKRLVSAMLQGALGATRGG